MEVLSIKCPDCNGTTEIDQSNRQGFCQYCGTSLRIKKSDSEGSEKDEKNRSDIEVKLADVKLIEEQYFNDEVQFDDVLLAYDKISVAGVTHAGYWLARARFYVLGNLREFEAGNVSVDRRKVVVDQYVLWMDHAIGNYSGNALELKIEKEKSIGDISNAFEGKKKKLEIEEVQRQERLKKEGEVEAFEEKISKHKKRNIIIAVCGVVLLLLVVLLLRTCGSNREEGYNVVYYEEFLELSNVLDLFSEDSTRSDILDLEVNFKDQSTDTQTLRVVAPEVAELDTITFHFDEDDLLERVLITNAESFNEFVAIDGFTAELIQHIEANFDDEIKIDDEKLIFVTDEFDVVLTLRIDKFNIDISRPSNELTTEQQVIWDLIETRIEEGYDSWSDLIVWAFEEDISFLVLEDGEQPIETLFSLIHEYGLIGDYTYAIPSLGSIEDPDEVVLLLHFENLTYNDTIAELSNLNRNSGSLLNNWLDGGGLVRLGSHFEEVEILNFDADGNIIENMPEIVEFVNWEIDFFDRFMPEGEGLIRIERVYRIIEIEEPEDEEEIEEEMPVSGGSLTLNTGSWVVGTDIPQGRYAITGSGSGSLFVRRKDNLLVNETIGGRGISTVTTYLLNGDEVEINGLNHATFTLANRILSRTLGTGNWIVGVDIEAGQFNAIAPTGTGDLIIWRGNSLITHETLEAQTNVSVNLVDGDIITISRLESVEFD